MKRTRKVFLGLLIVLVAYIFLVPMRPDTRLLGSFEYDAEATNNKWKPLDDTTLQDTYNILGQIFGESPIRFTDRTMTMRSQPEQLVNRYWVIWRGKQASYIFVRPFTFFRVEYEGDEMWLKIVPRNDKYLYVKLKRMDDPT